MKLDILAAPLICAAACLAAAVGGASAQTTKYVAYSGDDASSCNRGDPCKTLRTALSKTAAGGEIVILGSTDQLGPVTITKSISILGSGANQALINGAGATAITIKAGPNDVVWIDGLTLSGGGSGFAGVDVQSAAVVYVRRSLIYGFGQPAGGAIMYRPAGGVTELYVSDTTLGDVASGGQGQGVGLNIRPTADGTDIVSLNRVRILNNVSALVADGTGANSSALLNVALSDSVVSGNTYGVLAQSASGQAPVSIMVDDTDLVNNGFGLGAATISPNSPNVAVARVSRSVVSGNGTAFTTTNSGQLFTYQNNDVNGNGPGDATPAPLPPLG